MNYQEYLQSEAWNHKRKVALMFWDNRCTLCFSPNRLQVHHRTYERLGQERITDLIVLCEKCHKIHHFLPQPIYLEMPQSIMEHFARAGY